MTLPHREAPNARQLAEAAQVGEASRVNLYADDSHAGRLGSVSQLPRLYLPPARWYDACGSATGKAPFCCNDYLNALAIGVSWHELPDSAFAPVLY